MKLPDAGLRTNEKILYFHTCICVCMCMFKPGGSYLLLDTKDKQMSQEAPKQFHSMMLEEYQRNNIT